jgi:hypothetical protein
MPGRSIRNGSRLHPRVERQINPRFNPGADGRWRAAADHHGMTITDYPINAVFVFVVLRQASERQVDLRLN